jgi:hypothetical protein
LRAFKILKFLLSLFEKCAHCDAAYDELKQKLSSSTEPKKEILNDLEKKIEESLNTLEGFYCLFGCSFFN